MLARSEKLRDLSAEELVSGVANFTGLTHNAPVLAQLVKVAQNY